MNVKINTEDGTEEFSDVVNVRTVPNEDSTIELANGEEVPVRPHAMELKFSDGSVEELPRAWDLHSLEPKDGKDWALFTRFIDEDGDYTEYEDVVALHTVPLDETLGDYTGETNGPPHPPHAVELKRENGETVRVPNDWDLTQVYINVVTGVDHAQ